MLDLAVEIAATPDGGVYRVPAPPPPMLYWPVLYLQGIVRAQGITIVPDVAGVTIAGVVWQDCQGITFDGMSFKVDPTQKKAFVVEGGARIHFLNGHFYGDGVRTDSLGILFMNASDCSVRTCEFHDLNGGLATTRCDHVTIAGNAFHDIGCDGVQINATSFVDIADNGFTRFFPAAGDHSDAIQFQGVGQTGPMTDITITRNRFIRGDVPKPAAATPGTQFIFMNDESGHGYQRVKVSGNAGLGEIYNGIAVSHVDQLEISGNLIASYSDTLQTDYAGDGNLVDIQAWILADAQCTNGAVTNNQVTSLAKPDGSTLSWSGNQTIAPPAPADAPALLAAWEAAQPPPPPVPAPPPPVSPPPAPPVVSPPTPAPPPPVVDPRDARIATDRAAFNRIVELGTAAKAKRQGPTKADLTAILAVAKAALA